MSGIQPNNINAPSPTKGDGDKPVVSKMVRCAICGKECNGTQGLIGHIRKHPNRGWKGLYPPREEVAAASGPALVQAPGQSEPTPPAPVQAPQAQAPEPAEPAPVEAGPPPQGQARLQLPDLNLPPPEDYM